MKICSRSKRWTFAWHRLPLPHRPVVIQNLELHSPAVRVVRADAGIVGESGLSRSDEELRQRPPERKLSELFELRKFVISDGSIRYEDRRIADAEPLVFRRISSDLGVTPQSGGAYAYQMHSSQPPFVEADASGTFDIDALRLELKQFAIRIESKRIDGESALPPKVQHLINELGIVGKISVNGSAEWPMRDESRAWVLMDANLADAQASRRGARQAR